MKYILAAKPISPAPAPSATDEPPDAASAVPLCDDRLISQMIHIILMAHDMHSDVVALTEALIQQVNQLLPQLATQYPDCYIALERAMRTAPGHDQANDQHTPPAEQPRSLAVHFTGREWDILRMMLDGLSNREIADRLVIAVSTVKWYVNQLYSKLSVHSRDEAIACAKMLFPVEYASSYAAQKPGRLMGESQPMTPPNVVPGSVARANRGARPLTF